MSPYGESPRGLQTYNPEHAFNSLFKTAYEKVKTVISKIANTIFQQQKR